MSGVMKEQGRTSLSRFKPYPAYKASGVEWLGEIPAHWEVKRLKRLASLRAGAAITAESIEEIGKYPVFGGNGIRGYTSSYTHEGEFPLIGRQGALCGCVNFASGRFWASEHAVVATPNPEINSHWLAHLLRAMSLNSYSESAAQPGLAVDSISALPVPMPAVGEQRSIAMFVDQETAKIDSLVAKKGRLIELLQEKRTALINQAVTKGLDPNVPMMDSGVEWLGEIPAHWEVVRLGWKIVLQRGEDITKDEQNDGVVPVVSSGGIASYHDKAFAAGPGVVVGRKGTAGAVYYVKPDFWPHDTTLWVREFRGNYPRYVFYKLCSMDLASFDTGTANPTLNRNLIYPVIVSWPPVDEQVAIAAFLDRETGKIDALVVKIREAVDDLKELRTALISAAVTGKIDVREGAV